MDFRIPANDFWPVHLLVHGTDNTFFIAEKTFSMTETMVFAKEKIFSGIETTVSAAENIFSETGSLFFASDSIRKTQFERSMGFLEIQGIKQPPYRSI